MPRWMVTPTRSTCRGWPRMSLLTNSRACGELAPSTKGLASMSKLTRNLRSMSKWCLLALSLACAKAPVEPMSANPADAMSVIGRFGIGHACPVEGRILTAGHVAVRLFPSTGMVMSGAYTYSQGSRSGFLSHAWTIASRDLGGLKVDRVGAVAPEEPIYFGIADTGPKPGQKVSWFEYNMRPPVLRIRERSAKVSAIRAGHFSFDKAPMEGASGSCVFNEDREVVGIVTWRMGLPPEGIAVNVTGKWKPW